MESILTFYETTGVWYLVVSCFIAFFAFILWYGLSRAVRASLLWSMREISTELEKYVTQQPKRARHYESGLKRLRKVADSYPAFQRSLNISRIITLFSCDPVDGEVVQGIKNCANDAELRSLMDRMEDVLAFTIFFSTPWVPILALCALSLVIPYWLLAKATRTSAAILVRIKFFIANRVFSINFDEHQFSC